MELLVQKRKPVRASFTRTCNLISQELLKEGTDDEIVTAKFTTLERLSVELSTLDTEILNCEYSSDELRENEWMNIEEYREKLDLIKVKVGSYFNRQTVQSNVSTSPEVNKRKLKLPEIVLKQFGGEIKDWLPFWGQFQRIHEDKEIQKEDKFHYLIQATIPGTRPRDIVNSFPATAENYEKVIESLKNRFGREELLVEFYIRELLGLIIKNVTEVKGKHSISELYDKLESYLRSLESIGMTSDKYEAILFPLVESCIPEDILRVWVRNQASVTTEENCYSKKLKQLLLFLRNEVEGEQRISLAKTGFKSLDFGTKKESKRDKRYQNQDSVPTANDLFSSQKRAPNLNRKDTCLFCDKDHETRNCFVANKMSLVKRNEEIKRKNGCYICLKVGHRANQCKTNVRCLICSRRHWAVMCRDLSSNKLKEEVAETKEDSIQNVSLGNASYPNEVLLQTLLINIVAKGKKKTVRALIDTGSQRSYILRETAIELGCRSNESESLIHALFGGVTTKREKHNLYEVRVDSIAGNYSKMLTLLEQSKICGSVTSLQSGPWTKEMKEKNIKISDMGRKDMKIEVLFGADTAGSLLTGKIERLKNGLVAMETLLGWTVMGKIDVQASGRNDLSSMITSMLIHTSDIENLWNLETLGITDFKEKKSDGELEEAV